MCERGDRRHDFQEWYPGYREREQKASKRSASQAATAALDLEAVREEVQAMRESIQAHEALLQEHREAVLDGKPSPLRPEDVDANEQIVAGLRANLPAAEAVLAELEAQHG